MFLLLFHLLTITISSRIIKKQLGGVVTPPSLTNKKNSVIKSRIKLKEAKEKDTAWNATPEIDKTNKR